MQHGFVRFSPEYDIQVTTQQSLDRVPDCLASVASVRQNPFQPGESVDNDVFLPILYFLVPAYTPLTVNVMGGPDTP